MFIDAIPFRQLPVGLQLSVGVVLITLMVVIIAWFCCISPQPTRRSVFAERSLNVALWAALVALVVLAVVAVVIPTVRLYLR